jgi:two-component system, cell cycle response regulator
MAERILVVDDEEINRELLEAILAEAGYAVVLAVDGPTALAAAATEHPDLILLDLLMPGMDGLEVCRRLKTGPEEYRAPILVITAVGHTTTKELLLTSGADDVVAKPFEADDLRLRVRALLKVRGIGRDLDRTLAYLGELDALRGQARAPSPPQGAGAPLPVGPDRGGATALLLVDDDPISLALYSNLLRERDFVVHTASSGGEGLALAAQHPVEAVLLDIVMPDMSGLAVFETLQDRDPDLPVIILTGNPTSQNAIAALKLGAFDFIVKGQDQTLVALSVHRAIRHRRKAILTRLEREGLQARIHNLEERLALEM